MNAYQLSAQGVCLFHPGQAAYRHVAAVLPGSSRTLILYPGWVEDLDASFVVPSALFSAPDIDYLYYVSPLDGLQIGVESAHGPEAPPDIKAAAKEYADNIYKNGLVQAQHTARLQEGYGFWGVDFDLSATLAAYAQEAANQRAARMPVEREVMTVHVYNATNNNWMGVLAFDGKAVAHVSNRVPDSKSNSVTTIAAYLTDLQGTPGLDTVSKVRDALIASSFYGIIVGNDQVQHTKAPLSNVLQKWL